jgi:hypothetical protein
MLSNRFFAVVLVLGLAFTGGEAHAYRLVASDDAYVDFKAFMQGWVVATENSSPDGDNLAVQPYMRRMRLLFSGQVHDRVKFFYGTLHKNLGKTGQPNDLFTTADAWAEVDLGRELKVDLGLLMVPFLHNFRQGGGTIHTIDWHLPLRKMPVTSHYLGRDTGLGLRGILFGDAFSYFLHVTKGTWSGDAVPRVTARAVFNLFDAEEAFHYAGTYLGKKEIVSFGAAVDWQAGGGFGKGGQTKDYYAVGGDVFVDMPVGEHDGVTVQVNGAYYKHSIGNSSAGKCSVSTLATNCKSVSGFTLLAEAGYRFGKVEPLVGFDWFRPDGVEDLQGDYTRLLAGLNYWWLGHRANLKLQYSYEKPPGVEFDQGIHAALLQAHVLFK